MSFGQNTPLPSKVVLKSTTTQSLSDRFTEIMNMKSPPKVTITGIRGAQAAAGLESTRQKRFQQQTKRRPGLEEAFQAAKTAKLKNRLGMPGQAQGQGRGRGQSRGPGSRRGSMSRGRGVLSGRLSSPRRGRGFSAGGRARGRGMYSRGGFNRGRGQMRGRGMGGRGRGRGGSRGRGRGQTTPASREQLDQELDAYMTKGDGR